MKYLLDANVLVHLLRNRYGVAERIARVGWDNCCISEITMIELLYGAEVSKNRERNFAKVEQLCRDLEVVPVSVCVREFCRQKARLRHLGKLIEDFDLLIGCTAVAAGCSLATENVGHLSRIEGLTLENWMEQ